MVSLVGIVSKTLIKPGASSSSGSISSRHSGCVGYFSQSTSYGSSSIVTHPAKPSVKAPNKMNDRTFFKREKSIQTPFELTLQTGNYSIVINRISDEGSIVGKVEMLVNGKIKSSAQSSQKISLLTVDKENNLAATGF